MFNRQNQEILRHVSRLEKQEVERVFKRVFRSEEGQKIISYLQSITFDRALNSTASDAQLRYAEGERSLLAKIIRLSEGS